MSYEADNLKSLQKRRGIAPRSKKQQRLERKRAPIRNAYLRDHPLCERRPDCATPSIDVHEPWSRARGGPIFDKRNMMAVCRWCHDYIHQHGIQSEAEGWLIPAARGPTWLAAGGRNSGAEEGE